MVFFMRISGKIFINPLVPVPAVTGHDKLGFGISSTSDVITFTKIGIIYIQLLQEEQIFPMMPRSE